MDKPKIADRMPAVLELDAGKYWWCRCGLSSNQPWCDGSHKGTKFEPIEFEVAEKKRYAMCTCKHSEEVPLCDGSHKKLPW